MTIKHTSTNASIEMMIAAFFISEEYARQQRKSRKMQEIEKGNENQIQAFIGFADIGFVEAIQKACKTKFPRTVKAFDRLNDSELGAIRRGGLRILPKTKLAEIAGAMEKDNFTFSMN